MYASFYSRVETIAKTFSPPMFLTERKADRASEERLRESSPIRGSLQLRTIDAAYNRVLSIEEHSNVLYQQQREMAILFPLSVHNS